MRKTLCIVVVLVLGFSFQAMADEPLGVFVNSNTNSIQFINPLTQEVSPSLLKGTLGTYGGGLFDVVITSNGNKAIISNFGDSKILVVGISQGFSGTPVLLQEITVGFFAEDMALTPDDQYVLVTDGGFSSKVAVVNLSTYVVQNVELHSGNQAQAVAISPDGTTVLFADYWNEAIHSYGFNSASGSFTYKDTTYVPGCRPVNLAISPDGKTVLVVSAVGYKAPVITFWGDKKLHVNGYVTLPTKTGQSCVFSKDGTKAYYLSVSYLFGAAVIALDVTAPGVLSVNDTINMSIPRGTSQLFGVDTIALDPSGNYLYVTNPTLSGGVVEITVIDVTTNTEVNQIRANGIPVGIAFTTIMTADEL